MSHWEIEDMAMGCLLWVFVLGLAALVFTVSADAVQGRRAFKATTACETQMKEPRRQLLGTKVVCVPIRARQDTSTVRLDVNQAVGAAK